MQIIDNKKNFSNIKSLLEVEFFNKKIDAFSITESAFEKRMNIKIWLTYIVIIAMFLLISTIFENKGFDFSFLLPILVIGLIIYLRLFVKRKIKQGIIIAAEDLVYLINGIRSINSNEISFERLIIFSKSDVTNKIKLSGLINCISEEGNMIKCVSSIIQIKIYENFKIKIALEGNEEIELDIVSKISPLFENFSSRKFENKIIPLRQFAEKYLSK
ncbi:hypothetical protein IMCC3317_13110 [Kordia antarctica]|uniref:Uncharacterized protein n=1 Tax=Kordia antarctica TaxID=1218801 RepID=A0A7L4ZGW9_9FLAO|nr:hypothetical protein [Kordia antarctica]QHI35963.1 hypothetical protein IMCC3317_13110 [Kordia antarctica]